MLIIFCLFLTVITAVSSMKAIVVGGTGALGKELVRALSTNSRVGLVVNVGLHANENLANNVIVDYSTDINALCTNVIDQLRPIAPFDAIYCVAGGWVGGGLATETFFNDFNVQIQANLQTSLLTAKISSILLQGAENPLLVFTGSRAAVKPSPGMLAYGMVKSSVHFLAESLAADTVASGLPANTRVRCILPNVLDTPANRAAMPKAKFEKWTPLPVLSERLVNWATDGSDTETSTMVDV